MLLFEQCVLTVLTQSIIDTYNQSDEVLFFVHICAIIIRMSLFILCSATWRERVPGAGVPEVPRRLPVRRQECGRAVIQRRRHRLGQSVVFAY